MKPWPFAMRCLQRDWYSGELRLIAIAIIIAVASLTAVDFFTDRVQRAMLRQANELLAADLVLLSSKPISKDLTALAQKIGLQLSNAVSFRSVVVHDTALQLAEIKAVDSRYPIHGSLRVSADLFSPESQATGVPASGTAWVDARLIQILGVQAGDAIELGRSQLTVDKILTYEPDRGGDVFNIAPRLLINLDDVPATGLILPGSQVDYRLFLGGSDAQIEAFRQAVTGKADAHVRIVGIREARPELKTALQRAEQFLGLAALVSIAIAGLAIAMSAQRYAVRHFDNCAILKCLGADQGLVTRIYTYQLVALAVASSVPGCLLGYLAQFALGHLMPTLIHTQLPAPTLRPLLSGFAVGLVAALGFAMPQLLRLRAVSPLRILRRNLSPMPVTGLVVYGTAVTALAVLAPWQAGNLKLTIYAFLGMLATGALLAITARFLIRLLQPLRSRVGVAWRYGVANIARRANQSLAQIVGIGMGIMVILVLTMIRTDLLERWQHRLPPATPNYFLINIQPDEVADISRFLHQGARLDNRFYPMIRARLVAINNSRVVPEAFDDGRAQRLATREFNLSWAKQMDRKNRLIEGAWWRPGTQGAIQFSVEQEIAETLGIHLGDHLTYSVAGQELTGAVVNIRWVEWDSFDVNFFVIANPEALENFAATYISSFFLPAAQRSVLLDLVRQFPSVTVFDVAALLDQVRTIMTQVTQAIEFVFLFTLVAGVLVLVAALQSTHDERMCESALLATLGANRARVVSGLVAEFVLIGLVAGVIATLGATAVGYLLAELVLRIEWRANAVLWLAAPLCSVIVVTLAGIAGTYRTVNTPPMLTLRHISP